MSPCVDVLRIDGGDARLPDTRETYPIQPGSLPIAPHVPCLCTISYFHTATGTIIKVVRQQRSTSLKCYENEVRSWQKKGNRRLRQCDYMLIRVLADYNASCHTAKRAEKKEDEDETKRMRVCENMVSA